MKILHYLSGFLLIIATFGCVKQFIPETGADPKLYVVDGLITDQPGRKSVSISRSIPLGTKSESDPVMGCNVWISDNLNNKYQLSAAGPGIYVTYADFSGGIGRRYTLNIEIAGFAPPFNTKYFNTIKSLPMELLPVPEIDSLYFKRINITQEDGFATPGEGCQIYLNTSDANNYNRFYRWDYDETWKVIAPAYPLAINRICWITNKSEEINVRTTTGLIENRIDHLPVKFISNQSDRLNWRYRIAVNQYSVNEDEYNYWSDLEKISDNTGSLYDIIPSSINGNLFVPGDPDKQVLGYFSVSSKRSKVIYIDEFFKGVFSTYQYCLRDTIKETNLVHFLFPYEIYREQGYWFVMDDWMNPVKSKQMVIVTKDRGCVDCTVRGTTEKPDYWEERTK
jgi:hypothetical protein